jgi:hypothetical protein
VVAEYDASSWVEQTSIASGNNILGDVMTTSSVNISTSGTNYSTASISPILPWATIDSLSATGVCGGQSIPVIFNANSYTINFPYTLSYSINGTPQSLKIINSVPYSLPTIGPGVYKLTGFTYTNGGVKNGVVDPVTVTDYNIPTTANAGKDTSLCLTGLTLYGNKPWPYNGKWSIVSGSGGTFYPTTSDTAYNCRFNGTPGSIYTLRWKISNGLSCSSIDDVVISFNAVVNEPTLSLSTSPVCQGTNGNVYTMILDPKATSYTWSYGSGGTGATIVGAGNSVTVNYSTTATSGVLSVTANNLCGTSIPRTMSIIVKNLPVVTVQPLNNVAFCSPGNTSFSVTAMGTGLTYLWQVSTDGGSTWSPASSGVYTNNTTPILTLTGATSSMNNYLYRCVVGGTCAPSATSAAATLTIYKTPVTGPMFRKPNM